jgi:predicted kinase
MEVVVLVGLPAAGKSSFFRERFAGTHRHVSKDLFPSARRPAKTQDRQLRAALEEGQNVVIDNTNASPEERAPILEAAKEYGAKTVAYVFPAKVDVCRERNAKREGKACIPVVGIYATAKRMRFPTPEEGFDEQYRVDLVEDGFEVRPWGEEDESERV